jgi:hypothetical protein
MKRFDWINVVFSPFKLFNVRCYVGKTAIGTPYWLPKKFFSYCDLGWKTKWSDVDYRLEWNPVVSFVLFGYQLAFTFYSEHGPAYWEAWLYYNYATDKTKSKKERIEQCKREFPQTWRVTYAEKQPEMVDYYDHILKN